jgi:cytochrome b561
MHVVLYAFMLGMPRLGWLAVSAKGAPIYFFDTLLPALIG